MARGNLPVVLILGLTLLLVIAGLNLNPCSANDLFWQLRVGREMVATHTLPRQDAYSWTRSGTPWTLHEWLAFLLLWGAYAGSGGFAGVWLLQTVLVVATVWLLYAFLLRETDGSPLLSFALALGGALVSRAFFQPRPHLFSYLFLVITVGALMNDRRQASHRTCLWLLSPLFALWVNLHAGVLVGVGILLLFAVGDALEAALMARGDPARTLLFARAKRLGWVTAACVAATLITPYASGIYHNVSATLGNATAMNTVVEWLSPDFHAPYGKWLETFLALLVLCLVGSRRRKEIAPVLALVALAHTAFLAYRNVPLFALTATLLIARHARSALSAFLARWPAEPSGSPSLFGANPPVRPALVVGVVFGLLSVLRVTKILRDASENAPGLTERIARVSIALDSFPERACRFLETERFPSGLRLYNDYDYGGYLIWRLPQFPVFVDGRADIYFGRVLEDYVKVHRLDYDWRAILARYKPDMVMLSAQVAQARLFAAAPDWTLVYADSPDFGSKDRLNMLIFVRNAPRYAALIARCRRDCAAFHPRTGSSPLVSACLYKDSPVSETENGSAVERRKGHGL